MDLFTFSYSSAISSYRVQNFFRKSSSYIRAWTTTCGLQNPLDCYGSTSSWANFDRDLIICPSNSTHLQLNFWGNHTNSVFKNDHRISFGLFSNSVYSSIQNTVRKVFVSLTNKTIYDH